MKRTKSSRSLLSNSSKLSDPSDFTSTQATAASGTDGGSASKSAARGRTVEFSRAPREVKTKICEEVDAFYATVARLRSAFDSMPSRRIFESSVVRAMPSRAAAPCLPPTTQRVSSSVCKM
jgi:hypothetical protein